VAVLQEELDDYDGKNRRGKVDILMSLLADLPLYPTGQK